MTSKLLALATLTGGEILDEHTALSQLASRTKSAESLLTLLLERVGGLVSEVKDALTRSQQDVNGRVLSKVPDSIGPGGRRTTWKRSIELKRNIELQLMLLRAYATKNDIMLATAFQRAYEVLGLPDNKKSHRIVMHHLSHTLGGFQSKFVHRLMHFYPDPKTRRELLDELVRIYSGISTRKVTMKELLKGSATPGPRMLRKKRAQARASQPDSRTARKKPASTRSSRKRSR